MYVASQPKQNLESYLLLLERSQSCVQCELFSHFLFYSITLELCNLESRESRKTHMVIFLTRTSCDPPHFWSPLARYGLQSCREEQDSKLRSPPWLTQPRHPLLDIFNHSQDKATVICCRNIEMEQKIS